MIRFKKGWVLLAIACFVLTLWAWDMVRDFKTMASGGPTVTSPSNSTDQ